MGFFRKLENSAKKAFSKNTGRTIMRKAGHSLIEAAPVVRQIGNIAGDLAPLASAIPVYGAPIAVGLKGASFAGKYTGSAGRALLNQSHNMAPRHNSNNAQLAVMPQGSHQGGRLANPNWRPQHTSMTDRIPQRQGIQAPKPEDQIDGVFY